MDRANRQIKLLPYAGITQIRYKGQYLYGIQSQLANSSPP